MANVKITELTAATALAGTDVLPIVDVGADATKKVSVSDLLRNLPDGTASAPALAFADDQNSGILSPAENELAFATSGTQRLVIDSSGQVGIGTASPSSNGLVTIAETTNARLYLTDSTLGNTYGAQLRGYGTTGLGAFAELGVVDNNSYRTAIKIAQQAESIIFNTVTSERMRIDSSGRLLVGHSSSTNVAAIQSQLQVVGADAATGSIAIRRDQNVASGPLLVFGKSRGSRGGNTAVQANDIIGAVLFNAADGTDVTTSAARIKAEVDGTPGSNDMPGRLVFETTANGASSLTERMRIDSSGNCGIGTTAPSANLDIVVASGTAKQKLGSSSVSGGSYTNYHGASGTKTWFVGSNYNVGGALEFFQSTTNGGTTPSSTPAMIIDSSGNIGVGTTSNLLSNSTRTTLSLNNTGSAAVALGVSGAREGHIFADANSMEISATGNYMYFTAGSSERMRIDTSGRLLVGTSSARSNFYNSSLATRFQVEGTAFEGSSAALIRNSNNSNSSSLVLAKSRGTSTGSNTIVQDNDYLGEITFQGNDGSEFVSAGSIVCRVDGTPGANDMPARLVFSTTADGGSSPSERMRIDSSGQIFFGATSTSAPSYFFTPDSGGGAFVKDTNSTNSRTAFIFRINGTEVGSIKTSSSSTAFNTSSDYRLKENVVDIADGITRVKQLQPKRFNFIADDSRTVDGFLAHEAQTVVPEAVTGTHNEVDDDNNPVYQGIDQSKLVPLLTAALQEAISKIETLETKVAALEAQ